MSESFIIYWIIWAILAVVIGRKKNIDPVTYWVFGLLLGLIGVVILLCMKTRLPKAPEGMFAVKCPRCNTVQNIMVGAADFECFQCRTVAPAPGDAAASR
jgi:hypothetical protein